MCSAGKPLAVNTNTSIGTITMPPPMPSSPAKNPTATPMAR